MENNLTHMIDSDNIYKIFDGDICVFSVTLYPEYKAVKIYTSNEVWEGPIDLINLTADIDNYKKK